MAAESWAACWMCASNEACRHAGVRLSAAKVLGDSPSGINLKAAYWVSEAALSEDLTLRVCSFRPLPFAISNS